MEKDLFDDKEMHSVYEVLKKKYKELSDENSVPFAGKYRASNFGGIILFAYNMPDKQLLLTVTDAKKITFTLKIGVDYVDAGKTIDLKENPREIVEWGWFDFENTDELLKMVEIMTFLA